MEMSHNQIQENSVMDAPPVDNAPVNALDPAIKAKYQRLFKTGLIWLASGVFLMGTSFLITFMLFHSDKSFTTLMYIMTTLGFACIMKGLANILGF